MLNNDDDILYQSQVDQLSTYAVNGGILPIIQPNTIFSQPIRPPYIPPLLINMQNTNSLIDFDSSNKRRAYASSSTSNSNNSSFENEKKKKKNFIFSDFNQVADDMQFLLSRIEESDIEISRLKQNHTQLNSSYYSARSEINILNEKIINLEKNYKS